MNVNQNSHKTLFEKMKDDEFVQKSQKYAQWTVPSLMSLADEQHPEKRMQNLHQSWQEHGPLLVNNLAAKLAGTLFPSEQPFFQAHVSSELEELATDYLGIPQTDIEDELTSQSTAACQRVFRNSSYSQLTQAMKHLIVTGNVLIYRDHERAQTISYGLDQFTCRRDLKGRLLDAILRESTYFDGLPAEIQDQLLQTESMKYKDALENDKPLTVYIYTRIRRYNSEGGGAMYEVTQEVDETPVGEPSLYPEVICPWIAPTWSHKAGENYGRGLVEEHAGSFSKLSEMSEAGLLYDVNMMKSVNLLASGAGSDIDELATSETGEWVAADPQAVQDYEAGDYQKSMQLRENMDGIFQNLARAFMYEGNQREAERVTATEIQQNAEVADQMFGGVYSSLVGSLQVPMAYLLLLEENPDSMQGMIAGGLKLDIVAGMAALGRASAVLSLLRATQEASTISGLMELDDRIDPHKLMDAVYHGNGVPLSDYKKSNEQMQAEQEAQQQQQQAQESAMQGTNLLQQQKAMQEMQDQQF